MKKIALLSLLMIAWAYYGIPYLYAQPSEEEPVMAILDNFEDPQGYVMVIAHRANWRGAPENSLLAIQQCIDMGVDMVEIDVRRTKDGHLILMHDETLDRTTNGTGRVSDWTLDSIRTLHLRNGQGRVTRFRIPTLQEAMELAKGKIMVNLDKCYGYFPEAYAILEETGTTRQVVMKGKYALDKVEADFGEYLDKVYFMPIVDLTADSAHTVIEAYVDQMAPPAFELLFKTDTLEDLKHIRDFQFAGTRPWVNAIFPHLCGNHDDDVAIEDFEHSYDWLLEQGFNMIQTDRPALLLAYLRERGLHL